MSSPDFAAIGSRYAEELVKSMASVRKDMEDKLAADIYNDAFSTSDLRFKSAERYCMGWQDPRHRALTRDVYNAGYQYETDTFRFKDGTVVTREELEEAAIKPKVDARGLMIKPTIGGGRSSGKTYATSLHDTLKKSFDDAYRNCDDSADALRYQMDALRHENNRREREQQATWYANQSRTGELSQKSLETMLEQIKAFKPIGTGAAKPFYGEGLLSMIDERLPTDSDWDNAVTQQKLAQAKLEGAVLSAKKGDAELSPVKYVHKQVAVGFQVEQPPAPKSKVKVTTDGLGQMEFGGSESWWTRFKRWWRS